MNVKNTILILFCVLCGSLVYSQKSISSSSGNINLEYLGYPQTNGKPASLIGSAYSFYTLVVNDTTSNILWKWNVKTLDWENVGSAAGTIVGGRDTTTANNITNKVVSNGTTIAVASTFPYLSIPRYYGRFATVTGYVNWGFDSLYRMVYVNGLGNQRMFRVPFPADVIVNYPYLANTTLADSGQVATLLSAKQNTISGTGYPKFSGTSYTFNSQIPLADLVASTISGISLGNNLFNHIAGTGLTGSNYNGSAVQTWTNDVLTGKNTSQTFYGGVNNADSVILSSTSATTKGPIYLGTTKLFKVVESTGYTGIGNLQGFGYANPQSPLHVLAPYTSPSYNNPTLRLETTTTGAVDVGPSIGFFGNTGTAGQQLLLAAINVGKEGATGNRSYVNFRVATGDAMRISSNGSLSITSSSGSNEYTGQLKVIGSQSTRNLQDGSSLYGAYVAPTASYGLSYDTAIGLHNEVKLNLASTYISSFGTITQGSGYTDGTYNNVLIQLSGNVNISAKVSIVVSGGKVTNVSINSPTLGSTAGWAAGNTAVFTVANGFAATSGNPTSSTGTGFSVLIGSVGTPSVLSYAMENVGNTLFRGGTIKYQDGNQGASKVLVSDATGIAGWSIAPTVISQTSNISTTSTSSTGLYTVPSGKTLKITGVSVIVTSASGITSGPSAQIYGSSSTILASNSMSGLQATGQSFDFPTSGISRVVAAGEPVSFVIGTAASGTSPSQTVTVHLIGYLY